MVQAQNDLKTREISFEIAKELEELLRVLIRERQCADVTSVLEALIGLIVFNIRGADMSEEENIVGMSCIVTAGVKFAFRAIRALPQQLAEKPS